MSNRRIGLIVLAAVVVLDLVLIGLALRPAGGAQAVANPSELLPSSVAGPASAAVAPSASGTRSGSAAPSASALGGGSFARAIGLRADGSGLSVQPGQCGTNSSAGSALPATGPAVASTLPAPVVGRVLVSDSALKVIAAGQDCGEAHTYVQNTDGSWADSGPTNGEYYLLPGTTNLITPMGAVVQPCSVTSVVGGSSEATVLCDNGDIRTVIGSNVQHRVVQSRIVAITSSGVGTYLAAGNSGNCPGLAVTMTTDAGGTWNTVGCIQDGEARGQVGIGMAGGKVVVVDGNGTVFRSADSGATFTREG